VENLPEAGNREKILISGGKAYLFGFWGAVKKNSFICR
jgi:hypothetical protein